MSLSITLSEQWGYLTGKMFGDDIFSRLDKIQRSFSVSGPSLWNSLPLSVRDPSLTMTQFCTHLKTFLFRRAYCTQHIAFVAVQAVNSCADINLLTYLHVWDGRTDTPIWIQELLVVRGRDGRPKRTPWQCTASVCVAGVHCWEISLGYANPWNVIFCLSCRFNLGFSCAYSLCIVTQ